MTSDIAIQAGLLGYSKGYRRRGSSYRDYRSSSGYIGGSSTGGSAQTQKEYSIYRTAEYHYTACFFIYPDLASKEFRKIYPTKIERKAAILLYKAKNR